MKKDNREMRTSSANAAINSKELLLNSDGENIYVGNELDNVDQFISQNFTSKNYEFTQLSDMKVSSKDTF